MILVDQNLIAQSRLFRVNRDEEWDNKLLLRDLVIKVDIISIGCMNCEMYNGLRGEENIETIFGFIRTFFSVHYGGRLWPDTAGRGYCRGLQGCDR